MPRTRQIRYGNRGAFAMSANLRSKISAAFLRNSTKRYELQRRLKPLGHFIAPGRTSLQSSHARGAPRRTWSTLLIEGRQLLFLAAKLWEEEQLYRSPRGTDIAVIVCLQSESWRRSSKKQVRCRWWRLQVSGEKAAVRAASLMARSRRRWRRQRDAE